MQNELQNYNLFFYWNQNFSTLQIESNIIHRFIKKCSHILLLITFFFGSGTLHAQTTDETANSSQTDQSSSYLPCGNAFPTPSDFRRWSLLMGGGAGYGVFRDMGTAPIRFGGPALYNEVGVRHERIRWLFRFDITTAVGFYENAPAPQWNFTTFDISNTIRISALRRIFAHLFTREWIGLGLNNFLDVTVNTNYENAAAGISEFIGPELFFRATQQIGISNWYIHLELGVMPVAAVLRPGYAYIDNYTASQPVLGALFDDYQWHAKPLAALSSEIGISYTLMNDNKLELNYKWDYHSSGHCGYWRFDHAMHTLQFNFLFNLKHKNHYEKHQD